MDLTNIKTKFEKKGMIYPFKKSNGKYGVRGSSIVDRKTELESLLGLIEYLKSRNLNIDFIKQIEEEMKK